MVRMARFLSDDPGWVDPDDRLADRTVDDDPDWDDPRARPRRSSRRRRRPNVPRVPDPCVVPPEDMRQRAKPRPRRDG